MFNHRIEKTADIISLILIILFVAGIVNPSIAPASFSPIFEKNHVFIFNIVDKINLERAPNIQDTEEKISKFFSRESILERDKEAFAYLNKIREKYGRRAIMWDDNIYNLAAFRGKDMYERKYFDHVAPDGKCAEHYGPQFNVRGSIAENLYGIYSSSYMHPSGIEAIDSWMTSRGHRYNLLYPGHIKGAIACGYSTCVFLAVGDGLWGCASGEKGLNYWKTAPRQPDEI